jgi:hypothetical protein
MMDLEQQGARLDDKEKGGVARKQTEMLDELRQKDWRRRMELRHRATTLIEQHVVLEGDHLLVLRGGGSVGADPQRRRFRRRGRGR